MAVSEVLVAGHPVTRARAMPVLPHAWEPPGSYLSRRTSRPEIQGRRVYFGKPCLSYAPDAICIKAYRTTAVDPLTGEQVPLFHPVRQRWSEHFRFKGYEMEGYTAVGRATVAMLDLNQIRRQRIRQVEESFGLYPPK